MKKQNKTKDRIVGYGVLSLFALTTLFPFYVMVVMGTHVNAQLFLKLNLWFGSQFMPNLRMLISSGYFRYFANSLTIALPATVLTCLSSAMGGYALSKFDFKGKRFLVNFVFFTLMLPGSLGTVAWVWQMKQFGWINTYWPFIIPAMGNTYGVFWMYQYSKSAVPKEIMESARVDGCGELRMFFQIIMPFLFPAVVALGLLAFVGTWNNYFGPMLILKNRELYTVPVGLATMGSLFRVEYSTRILGMTIATIPLIALFVATSKHFIFGLTGGALKG